MLWGASHLTAALRRHSESFTLCIEDRRFTKCKLSAISSIWPDLSLFYIRRITFQLLEFSRWICLVQGHSVLAEEDRLLAVVEETVLYLSDKVEGRPSSKDTLITLKG